MNLFTFNIRAIDCYSYCKSDNKVTYMTLPIDSVEFVEYYF